MEENDNFCHNLSVKIGEVSGKIESIIGRLSSLEATDKQQFQLLTILVAVVLGLNNPVTKALLPITNQAPATAVCPANPGEIAND